MRPPSVSRRQLLAGALGAGTVGVGVEAAAGAAPSLTSWSPDAGDWPAPRRGPRRTAAAPEADPPGDQLSVEWEEKLPGSATLVVEDGTLYAGRQSGVVAFDLETGDRDWERSVRGVDLCVRDGRLYCGGGRDGDITALKANGVTRWTVETEPGRRTYDLLPVGNTLLVGRHGTLEGLDPETGTRRWKTNVGGLGDVTTAVVDGTLYTGGPGPLELYRPREGWNAVLEAGPEQVTEGRGPVFGSYPAVGSEGVYIGGFGFSEGTALYGFDREGGRRWRGPDAFSLTSPTIVDGDPAVGVSRLYDDDSREFCLAGVNLADGTERWRRDWAESLTEPVLAGDAIVVAQNSGAIRGINPQTGATDWEATVEAAPETVIPTGERLLVSGVEGRILSLR